MGSPGVEFGEEVACGRFEEASHPSKLIGAAKAQFKPKEVARALSKLHMAYHL